MGTKKEAMVMPIEYVICSWAWPSRNLVALFPMKCCGGECQCQAPCCQKTGGKCIPCTRWRRRPW